MNKEQKETEKILMQHLEEIDSWLMTLPQISELDTHNKWMKFLVEELMPKSLYLLRVGASLCPDLTTSKQGWGKNKAIIVGHMVRLAKLYEGFCIHTAKEQTELAAIFMRPIQETTIRMKYLMLKSDENTFRSYIVTSYKSERQSLADLNEKEKSRKLIPIERRIKNSIMDDLRDDDITVEKLDGIKSWNIDGKTTRDMLKELGDEWSYSYGFGGASRWVHGNWVEMKRCHLQKKEGGYFPQLNYSPSDPRYILPTTIIVLSVLLKYLIWNKIDPNQVTIKTIKKMLKATQSIDSEHEQQLIEFSD